MQGGVDISLLKWVPYDGVGRTVRNGLNFTERGYGVRAAVGVNDRGHTAISQVKPGDFDFESIFGPKNGSRWLHTGGIFAALSASTAQVAEEAMDAARKYGTPISYDLNYRDSLWKSIGGKAKAQEVNREIVRKVDMLLGNEEDFSAMLGVAIKGVSEDFDELPIEGYSEMLREVVAKYPNLKLVASTLRTAQTASNNAWGAIAIYEDKIVHVPQRDIDIYDRVGGGDSFASGLIYGMLANKGIDWAVRCGVAHGALAMTTPGDTSMATLSEVEKLIKGRIGSHRPLKQIGANHALEDREEKMSETTQQILERVGLIPVLRAKKCGTGPRRGGSHDCRRRDGGGSDHDCARSHRSLKRTQEGIRIEAPSRIGNRDHGGSVPGHHRCWSGVCGQPQLSSSGN